MDIKKDIIGIVGGMGSYATLNIFERILNAFDGKMEWDRPRIIIDNNCTLPSRSRALLYNEQRDTVVNGLAKSVKKLMDFGANIILLGSNTAHLFLDEILQLVPDSRPYIVNIVEKCAENIASDSVKNVLLLGTDATVDLGMYKRIFAEHGTEITTPPADRQREVVEFIETVKQNKITEKAVDDFARFLADSNAENIVLGCTELPVLYEKCLRRNLNFNKKIFDPIDSVIKYLKAR